MTAIPPALLESLRADHPEKGWPGALALDPTLRVRFEAALSAASPAVREVLSARLEAGAHELAGVRAALQVIGLARLAGAEATDWLDAHTLRVQGAGGAAAVAVLPFTLHGDGVGAGADLRRVVEAVEASIDERRFALHVRRPLPAGVDATPIAQAVRLWLRALRQGAEQACCASYDDGLISVEICLLEGAPPKGKSGRIAVVQPRRSLEHMAEVDRRLMAALAEVESVRGGLPVIAALVADRPWPVSRGYVNQFLYGTPVEVRAERDAQRLTYEARFATAGLALFSDPLARALGAAWWVEPDAQLVGARAWSSLNPWAHATDGAPMPALPGRRFAPLVIDGAAPVAAIAAPGRSVIMRWHDDAPAAWEPT